MLDEKQFPHGPKIINTGNFFIGSVRPKLTYSILPI